MSPQRISLNAFCDWQRRRIALSEPRLVRPNPIPVKPVNVWLRDGDRLGCKCGHCKALWAVNYEPRKRVA